MLCMWLARWVSILLAFRPTPAKSTDASCDMLCYVLPSIRVIIDVVIAIPTEHNTSIVVKDTSRVIVANGLITISTIANGFPATPMIVTLALLLVATTHAEEQLHDRLSVQHSIVTQDVAVLQSLALTGEALLTSKHTFLVLDHLLDVVHTLRRMHMQSERGSPKGLDENLKACRGRVIDMGHCYRRVGVLSSLV